MLNWIDTIKRKIQKEVNTIEEMKSIREDGSKWKIWLKENEELFQIRMKQFELSIIFKH